MKLQHFKNSGQKEYRFILNGEVGKYSPFDGDSLAQELNYINSLPQEELPERIILNINSGGGSIYQEGTYTLSSQAFIYRSQCEKQVGMIGV